MSKQEVKVAMPNVSPTQQEIFGETLQLDGYGIEVSRLLQDYPVESGQYIGSQTVLDPLIDFMAREGWLYSGSGFFAAVFVKGGLALKLGFKPTDAGAMYAVWCRANQGLPGVPTIYSMTKFLGCYLVLMRRYEELDVDLVDEDSPSCVPSLFKEFNAIARTLNTGTDYERRYFPVVDTAARIREFFAGMVDFDLHAGNVMMDSDGELVITDPIGNGPCSADTGYTTTANRLTYRA